MIQEELLNEFGSKGELSSWFDREDIAPAVLVKKPNPRNIQNAEKLQQLEAELARYVILCNCLRFKLWTDMRKIGYKKRNEAGTTSFPLLTRHHPLKQKTTTRYILNPQA